MVRIGAVLIVLAWTMDCSRAQDNPLLEPGNGVVSSLGSKEPLAGRGAPIGKGGSQNADFDSLIDLIVTTVAPDTWVEGGGGQGDIRPFPIGGVYVDAAGLMRQREARASSASLGLARRGVRIASSPLGDPRRTSNLRYISLARLEAEIARRTVEHAPLEEAMLTMAGLRRVRYVFAVPETQDIVLAGPAGDWRVDEAGRIIAADTGVPVVRLDDLLTLLRATRDSPGVPFGCSINPRTENLAAAQAFLKSSRDTPLATGKRQRWLEAIRAAVGEQDIEVFGIDPASRVARILVEADHHMKLIGMDLADGVLGVESFLDTVELDAAGAAPPMNVLRCWFSLSYASVNATPEKDGYELNGPGARVLGQNELLTSRGERVHTGQSDEATQRFAQSFSQHFAELCVKHPVYGELRNVFDLAMVTAIIWDANGGLAKQAGWKGALLHDASRLPLPAYAPARSVESVVNHRIIDRRTFVAGVSGGVWIDAKEAIAKQALIEPGYTELSSKRPDAPAAGWWWDHP